MSRAIILVGRALGAPTAERALTDLARRLDERIDDTVTTAMLDHGAPSLHEALDACAAAGTADVLVLPIQVPRDRYLETWVSKAIAHWRNVRTRSGPGIEVRVGVGVSETAEMVDALVAASDGPAWNVADSPASFRSPSWSIIGSHRHHVLVCRGPRCSSHGSPAVAKALAACLQSGPVGYDDVLVTNTGCLVPCNLGPIVVVQPDDTWYTSVDEKAVERIVDEHLTGGSVVNDLHTPRTVQEET